MVRSVQGRRGEVSPRRLVPGSSRSRQQLSFRRSGRDGTAARKQENDAMEAACDMIGSV